MYKSKVLKLLDKKDKIDQELKTIFEKCKHHNSHYKNEGNVSDWDGSSHYWREYWCEDCMSSWTTDQDHQMDLKFPHSINTTYDNKIETPKNYIKYIVNNV